MPLSFVVRSVDEIRIIDWSLAGGRGCRPATGPEIEMVERIAELEAALAGLITWVDTDDFPGRDEAMSKARAAMKR